MKIVIIIISKWRNINTLTKYNDGLNVNHMSANSIKEARKTW